jgi:hypothetical protein
MDWKKEWKPLAAIVAVFPGMFFLPLIYRTLGGNSPGTNFFDSFAGAFIYVATFTEITVLHGLIGKGMGQGPAFGHPGVIRSKYAGYPKRNRDKENDCFCFAGCRYDNQLRSYLWNNGIIE